MDVDKEVDMMSEWINEKGEAAGQMNLSQRRRKHMKFGHLQNDSLETICVMCPQEVPKASDKHPPVCRSWYSEWWQLWLWYASCLGWGQPASSEGVPLSSVLLVGASSLWPPGMIREITKDWEYSLGWYLWAGSTGNQTFLFEILEMRREGAREREEDVEMNQCVRDRDAALGLKSWTSPASTRSRDWRFW